MDSGALFQRNKRGLYVAYDHGRDENAYASFSLHFSSIFRLHRDNSLERELGSDDPEAHIRFLREGPMAGCEGVAVLCGASAHLSRYVDWEIKAALEGRLALIAVVLPANPGGPREPVLPERLRRNFESGYAVLVRSDEILDGRVDLGTRLDFALRRPFESIDNGLPPRTGDG